MPAHIIEWGAVHAPAVISAKVGMDTWTDRPEANFGRRCPPPATIPGKRQPAAARAGSICRPCLRVVHL